MRKGLEELLLRVVRAYTANTPLKKGKYRLYLSAVDLCRETHRAGVMLSDGRKFSLTIPNPLHESVYFLGEYEPFLSEITKRLIKPGDICIDVGANFGWYTSLMALSCGDTGQVHSFEPIPDTFDELRANFDLWGRPANVFINEVALGDRTGSISVNTFSDLTTGHSSIGLYEGHDAVAFDCRMTTLNAYCSAYSLDHIDFAKVDIEGAEKIFLDGADGLFQQAHPPIFLMEMARLATMNFGYLPGELLPMLRARADYNFYLANEVDESLEKIDGFADNDIGGNVFCIPAAASDAFAAIRPFVTD